VSPSAAHLAWSFTRYRAARLGIVTAPLEPIPSERDRRLGEITTWLASLYFGATRRQVVNYFPQHYPGFGKRTTSERRLHRDLRAVLASGRFVKAGTKIIRADRASRI
jgi:hypothetical protein